LHHRRSVVRVAGRLRAGVSHLRYPSQRGVCQLAQKRHACFHGMWTFHRGYSYEATYSHRQNAKTILIGIAFRLLDAPEVKAYLQQNNDTTGPRRIRWHLPINRATRGTRASPNKLQTDGACPYRRRAHHGWLQDTIRRTRALRAAASPPPWSADRHVDRMLSGAPRPG